LFFFGVFGKVRENFTKKLVSEENIENIFRVCVFCFAGRYSVSPFHGNGFSLLKIKI